MAGVVNWKWESILIFVGASKVAVAAGLNSSGLLADDFVRSASGNRNMAYVLANNQIT